MSWLTTLPSLAISPDLEHIIAGSNLSEAELQAVRQHKERLLLELRTLQTDEAGFYRCLPASLKFELEAASVVSISVETTAPSRFSLSERVHRSSRVGQETWQSYRAKHPKASADARPRPRVITVFTKELGAMAFDLDALDQRDRHELLKVAISGKVVIGHDLACVLPWFFAESEARPRLIVDTRLLVQHVKPTMIYRPFHWAAKQGVRADLSRAMIVAQSGNPQTSLAWIAHCSQLPPLDPSYADHRAWSVTVLSADHRAYSQARALLCVQIVDQLVPHANGEHLAHEVARLSPTFQDYASASIRLAEAHLRGLPMDIEAVLKLEAGLGKSDEASQSSRQPQCEILRQLKREARTDGRLHSVVGFTTATGRTSSRRPALQNIPREEAWRDIVRAKADHVILAVDYAAMEMRVAASLAARTIAEVRNSLKSRDRQHWFFRQVELGLRIGVPLELEVEFARGDLEGPARAIQATAQRVLRGQAQTMQSAFAAGVDVHLVTALEFARRAGKCRFEGSALQWLESQNLDERRLLKIGIYPERQAAKACNFGLLYGMGAKGLQRIGRESYELSWTLGEAQEALEAWHELYPEIMLWRLWTKYACSSLIDPGKVCTWHSGKKILERPRFGSRFFEATTLSGRPVKVLGNHRRALNYQSQGTVSDILAAAIAGLSAEAAQYFLLPVHDELLFEVPKKDASRLQSDVESTMIAAARKVLGVDMPIEVESSLSECWS